MSLSFLPAIDYPAPGEGVWGPVTATLDWCEENYYATKYCAEIINSVTNLTFAYLGYKGILSCIQNGHDNVFIVAYGAYLIIGLSSFLFHTTLTLKMQLLDEISMIYTACVMLYAVFSHGRTTVKKALIGMASTSLAVGITAYYFHCGDPVFHQAAFFLLTVIVLSRGVYVMETNLRPRFRKQHLAIEKLPNAKPPVSEQVEQAKRDARDKKILSTMYKMLSWATFCGYGGFTIWNLDNIYCSTIKGWRHEVGMPWGFALEGHGWWHIMTGIAAYQNIVWNIWLRTCLKGQQDEVKLVWPSLMFSVPSIERKDKQKKL